MPELQNSFNAHAPQREVSLADAQALVVERFAAAGSLLRRQELVPLADALGRVLARPVLADRDLPPFARSLRDGYAVRAADCATPGARLNCTGRIAAGQSGAPALKPGACVEIMTGAPVPAGADAVVMVERTQRDGGTVTISPAVAAGDHIAPAGSDSPRGAPLVAAGHRLTPAALAALAAAGRTEPTVFARPRVALIATGDELVPAAASPGPAQIRDANSPALAALAARAGAEVVLAQCTPDDAAAVAAALDASLAAADLVVFTGGASVGAHDLVAPVLAARGVEFYFDAVRMRPGRPVLFGSVAGKLFFGLPGNPLGTLLAGLLFLRPALDLLAGFDSDALPPAFLTARLGAAYQGSDLPLAVFRPARFRAAVSDPTASPELLPIPLNSSADLAAAAAADAFFAVPEHTTALPQGSLVQMVLQ